MHSTRTLSRTCNALFATFSGSASPNVCFVGACDKAILFHSIKPYPCHHDLRDFVYSGFQASASPDECEQPIFASREWQAVFSTAPDDGSNGRGQRYNWKMPIRLRTMQQALMLLVTLVFVRTVECPFPTPPTSRIPSAVPTSDTSIPAPPRSPRPGRDLYHQNQDHHDHAITNLHNPRTANADWTDMKTREPE